MRRRVAAIAVALVAANLAVWGWAFAALGQSPTLLGTAFIAYAFGLRHAIDADHIAAIDNVTRKLMQAGGRPLLVGFFFAAGHSSIVIAASAAIALTASALSGRVDALRDWGGIISTSLSAGFLFAIALMNLFILRGVWRTFQRVRAGFRFGEEDLDLLLAQGGVLARLFRPVFGLLTRSWQMFPLGLLFGLGFETATEVALLGISAEEAAKGVSIWSILVFPALFAAGMALIDTTDGILMVGAYGWAFLKPIRKLYYNMTITFVSVVAAAVVGGVEVLGLLQDRLGLTGAFWRFVAVLGENSGAMGAVIIATFVVTWLASALIYRVKGFDRIETQ